MRLDGMSHLTANLAFFNTINTLTPDVLASRRQVSLPNKISTDPLFVGLHFAQL